MLCRGFGLGELVQCLHGCLVSDRGVHPFPVVENLDVVCDCEPCAVSGGESVAVIHFVFQGSEERFCCRVIPTDSGAAHASGNAVLLAVLSEIAGRVLSGFNQSLQHPVIVEVLDGSSSTVSGSGGAPADEVAGCATASSRNATIVLD